MGGLVRQMVPQVGLRPPTPKLGDQSTSLMMLEIDLMPAGTLW
jgi:hypothetical protein